MGLQRIGGGGSEKKVSNTPPENPEQGQEWVDTSFSKPATKLYIDDEWVEVVKGSNIPEQIEYEKGTYDVDVSSINEVATFELASEPGQDFSDWATEDLHRGHINKSYSGGSGCRIRARVDLSRYSDLRIYVGSYQSGNTNRGGGSSSAIIADGTRIISAGGGGGGGGQYEFQGSYDYWYVDGYYGGDGGGPNPGSGGSLTEGRNGAHSDSEPGGDGGLWRKPTITELNAGTSDKPFAKLFMDR